MTPRMWALLAAVYAGIALTLLGVGEYESAMWVGVACGSLTIAAILLRKPKGS